MPFEEFQRPRSKGRKPDPTPRVSIYWWGGLFRLNGAAFAALGQPRAVVLLIDPVARVMALRPCGDEDENAFRARRVPGEQGARISATEFCRHYGLKDQGSRSYAARIEGGLLQFDLDD